MILKKRVIITDHQRGSIIFEDEVAFDFSEMTPSDIAKLALFAASLKFNVKVRNGDMLPINYVKVKNLMKKGRYIDAVA